MTGQQLINRIRRYTRTNSGNVSFDDSTVLEIINEEYGTIMAQVIQAVGDYNVAGRCLSTDFLNTDGLTKSDVGYDGTYSFPVDLLRPVRAEVTFDGEKYVPATIYDINDNQHSEFNWENEGEFEESQPFVRFFNDKYVVRPTPKTNITKGVRIWYEHRTIGDAGGGDSHDITTTTSPILEEVFHPLIVWRVCMNYGMIFPEKANPKWEKKAYGTEMDMLRFYSNKFGKTSGINVEIDDYSV